VCYQKIVTIAMMLNRVQHRYRPSRRYGAPVPELISERRSAVQQQCYSGGEPSSGGDSSDEQRRGRKPKGRDHSGGGHGSDGHRANRRRDDHNSADSDGRQQVDRSRRHERRQASSSDEDSSDNEKSRRSRDTGRDCSGRRENRSPIRQELREKGSRWMKPEKFDGKSSFETFLAQFENCATYNAWNERDKVAHLRWSLTGIAAQLLWNTTDLSYRQLVEKLQDRFGGKGLEEKFQNELRCRRRTKNESIRELAQDIQRLMTLAYPGERSKLSEHLARDSFLIALDDPEMELKVREREPEDLESAVKLAQRFEVFKGAVEATSSSNRRYNRAVTEEKCNGRCGAMARQGDDCESHHAPSNRRQEFNRNRQVSNQVGTNEDQKWKQDITRKIDNLQQAHDKSLAENKKIAAENAELSKEIGRLRHLEQLRSTATQPGIQNSWPPQRRQPTAQPSANGRSCFNCGDPSHFARNCPVRQQTRRNGDTEVSATDQDAIRANGVTKGGLHTEKGAVYLRTEVEGRSCDCLLDTGSELSILPAFIVRMTAVNPSQQVLRAANGTAIPVLGETTIWMNVGTLTLPVTGLVTEHVDEIMLGIDWLVAHKVQWDFAKGKLLMYGQEYQLRSRASGQHWIRKVVLQTDVNVPPRAETVLSTKVVYHDLGGAPVDGCWGTEPALIRSGLYVSRTLIPEKRSTDVMVRVLNARPHSVCLPAGLKIADLQPLDVVSPHSCESESQTEPAFITALLKGIHSSVPESAAEELGQLLSEFQDAFSRDETDLGRTNVITHTIDTADAKPFRQQLRRFPPAHVAAISDHVDSMLAQGIIEPACSPWASNIVLVRKKDGSFRCCVDYRQLNLVTRKDAYPLPRIDVCLDAMAKAKWFSTFDLRSSYHQVNVNPQDMDKTAFICPRGMFRFRTMPFGLCNAGASFQRLMDIVMSGLHPELCLVYLDDIIVFSETISEHLQRLRLILTRI
jgi:hypothetical protein